METSLVFLHHQTALPFSFVDTHKHTCFELVYYIKGTGRMLLENEPYYFSPNTFTFTRPDFYHEEEHYEAMEYIFIGFSYDDKPISIKNGLYHDSINHTILHLLDRMKNEMISKKLHYAMRLDLLIREILIELDRMQNETVKPKHRASKLFYAIRLLEENYTQPIDLHSLAALCGYSFDRFRHLFKEETGHSLMDYIMDKRFVHAKQMLETSNSKISIIASESGFSTLPQFCKLFKEHTGMTPLEYRKH
jgi:AraC-like DNA-binding protein